MKLRFLLTLVLSPLVASLVAVPAGGQTNQAAADAAPAVSSGIADVLKMLDAHVSPEVIKAYIENSASTFDVTPSDLIVLKQHNVTDDVTVALLKHGATSATAAPATAPAAATPAQASAPIRTYVINTGRTDPEGYDFFRHNYLMPRTQANINQTLGYAAVPYGDTFVPYYPPGLYNYGFGPGVVGGPGVIGGINGVAAGTRNPFNVGRNLQGGFMIRR